MLRYVSSKIPFTTSVGIGNEKRMLKFLALLLITYSSPQVEAYQNNLLHTAHTIVIRGRVVCLAKADRFDSTTAVTECNSLTNHFGFVDHNMKLYTFSSSDPQTAMFGDARIREHELQVTAELGEENRLEVIQIQSLQAGRLYNIYYFCEICNIKAYAPGICPCCGKELELKETPVQ